MQGCTATPDLRSDGSFQNLEHTDALVVVADTLSRGTQGSPMAHLMTSSSLAQCSRQQDGTGPSREAEMGDQRPQQPRDPHTQPYSYHTVWGSPPGSGDAGTLRELPPRPRSSGAMERPGHLAESPSLGPMSPSTGQGPARTGATVATSPACVGP